MKEKNNQKTGKEAQNENVLNTSETESEKRREWIEKRACMKRITV